MRVLRLLVLAAVLLFAYCAQYLFDHGTLAGLYPGWATQRFPWLVRSTLWLPDDLYALALWLMGGSALVFGLLAHPWRSSPPGSRPRQEAGPSRWWLLLALLSAVAMIVGWGWTDLPARIDAGTAAFALQGQAMVGQPAASAGGNWLAPLAPGAGGAPRLASLPLGLLAALLGSAPAASHLLGLMSALAVVAAAYLLAGELLRASPQRGALALLAAGFTGATLALLHFGRLAPYLPATAAGTAAAWLLLAGQRTHRRTWLALSGVLAGLAPWFDRSGLVFVAVLLLWWVFLRPKTWRELAVWASCALAVLSPLLLSWLMNTQAAGAYLYGGQAPFVVDWWRNLRAAAATFFWLPDASTTFGGSRQYVDSLVAPLFVLALGGLLLSIHRLPGWCLLSWLAVGLLFSSSTSEAAPYWPTLLPLLPVVGLAVAFALERIGALWQEASQEGQSAGESSASASLAVGLLLAVLAITAAGYYQHAANGGDPASYTGRALATLKPGEIAVLVASTPAQAVRLDDPVVRYAAGVRANQALAVLVDALPGSLPAGSLLIVQGGDPAALAAVQARYPQAAVEVVRDLGANPRLYLLRAPAAGG
jgi:hypothetical protein